MESDRDSRPSVIVALPDVAVDVPLTHLFRAHHAVIIDGNHILYFRHYLQRLTHIYNSVYALVYLGKLFTENIVQSEAGLQ